MHDHYNLRLIENDSGILGTAATNISERHSLLQPNCAEVDTPSAVSKTVQAIWPLTWGEHHEKWRIPSETEGGENFNRGRGGFKSQPIFLTVTPGWGRGVRPWFLTVLQWLMWWILPLTATQGQNHLAAGFRFNQSIQLDAGLRYGSLTK